MNCWRSPAFIDADFYIKSNPDLAALNIDPLLHYLERGCHERRDLSARFDTEHYLRLCQALGESPANPLAHYLTTGIRRGLTPRSGTVPAALPAPSGVLSIDIPRISNGVAEAPVRGGLSIVGWAVSDGTATIDIALDGQRVARARHGLRRPDVAAAHPEWSAALQSGFAVHLPPKALASGRHQIAVSLLSGDDVVARREFVIDVSETRADSGPGVLRRRMVRLR